MNNIERIQKAIIQADAEGNEQEIAILGKELRRLQATQDEGMTIHGQDKFKEAQEKTRGQPRTQGAVTDPMHYNRSADGFEGSFLHSVAKGVKDQLDAGAQVLYNILPESAQKTGDQLNNQLAEYGLTTPVSEYGLNQQLAEDERNFQIDRERAGRGGIDAGRIFGNIAGTLPLVSAKGLQLVKGGNTIANLLRAGGQGAIVGGAQPVYEGDFAKSKLNQLGYGAMFGAGGYPLGSALGRVLNPKSSPDVQHLLKHGVKPTAGQVLGGGFRSFEDKLMSVPFIGDAIKHGRKKATEEFNRAAMSRALRGTGVKAKDIPLGQDGIARIYGILDDAYDDVYNKVTFKQDQRFKDAVAKISDKVENLGGREAKSYKNLIRDFVSTKLKSDGSMDGKTFKKLHTKIRQEATKFSKSPDPFHQELGTYFREINEEIANAVKRTNPQFANKIGELQRNYANYIRLEKAAGTTADISEGFTPAMLHKAVKSTNESLRKSQYSKNKALMQDLSGSGSRVMNSKIPNSGTTDRLLLAALLGGGGYSLPATAPYMPFAIGGTALASLPALGGGRQAMAALLAQRPKVFKEFGKAITQTSPVIASAAAPTLKD